jgi:hypothetical protein
MQRNKTQRIFQANFVTIFITPGRFDAFMLDGPKPKDKEDLLSIYVDGGMMLYPGF